MKGLTVFGRYIWPGNLPILSLTVAGLFGVPAASAADLPEFVELSGGTFLMGEDRIYREETEIHQVTVSPFAISRTEITNAQFREFVEETGYVTSVEKPLDPADYPGVPEELLQPGSMVFAQPAGAVDMGDIGNWWRYVAGANWQHPTGPDSNIDGLDDHPVTQVSIEDARAYAKWAGGRLATEAEWEFAARGGLSRKAYVWGDTYDPAQGWKANSWQGQFPTDDLADDGYHGTAPVGQFTANGYGLYDMAGNVWEHVNDWWVPGHPNTAQTDPSGPPMKLAVRFASSATGPMTVVKGGSWLCAPNFCLRYRPAARQPAEGHIGSNHIGFRIVRDIQ